MKLTSVSFNTPSCPFDDQIQSGDTNSMTKFTGKWGLEILTIGTTAIVIIFPIKILDTDEHKEIQILSLYSKIACII